MDVQAARRARQRSIKADLTQAYTDDEACPPEWVELMARVRREASAVQAEITAETRRFVEDADIRRALGRRDSVSARLRDRIEHINRQIRRLNVIAPHPRFTRAVLDVDEALRPLYRSRRNAPV